MTLLPYDHKSSQDNRFDRCKFTRFYNRTDLRLLQAFMVVNFDFTTIKAVKIIAFTTVNLSGFTTVSVNPYSADNYIAT